MNNERAQAVLTNLKCSLANDVLEWQMCNDSAD